MSRDQHEGYVPERGDIVWLSFSPTAGHEQAGRRPALVISPAAYNRAAGLSLMCPITSKAKGYPFEVTLHRESGVQGVALADQVRSLDWRARRAELAGVAPADVVAEVLGKLHALLD